MNFTCMDMEDAISERAASARNCPANVAVFVFVEEPAIEVPPPRNEARAAIQR